MLSPVNPLASRAIKRFLLFDRIVDGRVSILCKVITEGTVSVGEAGWIPALGEDFVEDPGPTIFDTFEGLLLVEYDIVDVGELTVPSGGPVLRKNNARSLEAVTPSTRASLARLAGTFVATNLALGAGRGVSPP